VGDHSHVFTGQNSLHSQSSVSRRIVIVTQPVLVPPSFRKFSADFLPQTLQNLQLVMLVHSLAWRNRFLVNNALTVKKDRQHVLNVRPTFESREPFKSLCSPHDISAKAVLSISCVSDAVFLSLEQNFMEMRCSFKSAIGKSWIAFNTHNNKHPLRSNTKDYGGKAH
jgi:hypothetical protein